MNNYYYSGQGSLFVAKRDANGNPTGFVRVGNVPELSIDIEVTKVDHKESETGNRNLDLTLVQERKGTFNLTLENLSIDNLALGLYGTASKVSAGTVTNEEVKYYPGMRMPLQHPGVSAVVVKDATATTTYVAPGDYAVDLKNGVLIFPETGGTPDAEDTLKVSYSYGAYLNLEAFTQAVSPERWLRFEGLNTVDGSSVIVDFYRAQFDPLTGYGLINEDVASVTMAGSLLADPTIPATVSTSQFFRQRNVAA